MEDQNYPRPQFRRRRWASLNGPWSFAFSEIRDPAKVPWQGWIRVPFPPESQQSGVKNPDYHPVIWYQRRFEIPVEWQNHHVLLHFGAVDYAARVWVNGRYAARHEGGHVPFEVDITDFLVEGEQILTVRAEDRPLEMDKPRGKQDWEARPHVIWYPRTTGIWQTVWIEPVPPTHIRKYRVHPDLDRFGLGFEITLEGAPGNLFIEVQLSLGGRQLVDDRWGVQGMETARWVSLPDPGADSARRGFLWSPDSPTLMDLTLTLYREEQPLDQIEGYVALRSVDARDGSFFLNGRPYFLQMVLDQGYWPESHLTPPDPEALKKDVELARAFGFNGVRKHQKICDPRYLYWADRLGLLVWAEMPSFYRYSDRSARRMLREFTAMVDRDYNHPCIVAWVPFNESWGLPGLSHSATQRHFLRAVFHLAKSLDSTRLVVDNDGWEHLETDLLTIHDYANEPEVYARRYGNREALRRTISRRPAGRPIYLEEQTTARPPVILSEFGGIRLKEGNGWGYGEAEDVQDLLHTVGELVAAVSDSSLAGFCYTQLVDTFQEQTGLAYPDRRPKVEPEVVAQHLKAGLHRRKQAEG